MAALEHHQLRKMVDVAAELTQEARQESEQARDYYDHHQLTEAEKAILRKRKQPQLVINRIQRKVDAMVGLEQKGRVDPRALPRNPQDEQAADVATKALVYVDDITRFDVLRSAFCYNLAVEGYGGVEVGVKTRSGEQDPDIIRLRWEEIFFDPYSRELDFSDADYMGVQKWMTLDRAMEFCRGYNAEMPDDKLEELLKQSMDDIYAGETYDDRPPGETTTWGDKKKKRVRLAYLYYRCEGYWRLALLAGSGVIYDEVSPYLDYTDDPQGVPTNAIILQGCYIDRENRRYGIVKGMIPMQDEINARRSRLLHMLNSRQTMGNAGAVVDVKKMKTELSQPDGHVEYDQDPQSPVPSFQIVPQADQIAGQFQLLQESKGEIDMLGPNASLLGQLEGDQSGRAIMAQQQAGMAELAPFYDNLRDWTLRVYRAMWNRIRQYWQAPRWIRVTDEQEQLQFVGINGAVGSDGMPGPAVSALDIDIIIDMTPEYASLQQEEFQSLVDLAKSGVVQIPPDVLIEASQLRNKAKLLEKLNGGPEQAGMMQMQQQLQMQAIQLQMEEMTKKIAKLDEEARNKAADTDLKAAQTEKLRVETQMAPIEMAQDLQDRSEQRQMDRQRFGEETRAGRLAESREGARMAEEFRSGRVSEDMSRTQADRDYELARKAAAKDRRSL